jgi:hydrogenase expression/formation protein HypC
MAIPSRVIAIDADRATVECYGVRREVSLLLLPEPAGVGDFVLVRSGAHAVELVDRERALEILDCLAVLAGVDADRGAGPLAA